MPDHLDDFAVPVDVEARYRVAAHRFVRDLLDGYTRALIAARDACAYTPDLNDDCWDHDEPGQRPTEIA